MDSKIILAILIVALLGIVAATYNNESSELIDTLSNVATEESPTDSVSSLEDIGIGSNSEDSILIDEDTVKPDTSPSKITNKDNKKTVSSSSSSSNNKKTTTPTKTTSNSNNNIKKNGTDNTVTTFKVSRAQAISTALSDLPEKYQGSTYKVTDPTTSLPYYMIIFYNGTENIGYYEIDANTNKITGGAFKDETPEVGD